MIDRDKFWNGARPIFGGPSQSQVDGTNTILDDFEKHYPAGDKRWLAYGLATAYAETKVMQPVREGFYLNPPGAHQNDATGPAEAYRKTLRYYPYYGRGLVQLTWEANYKAVSPLVNGDLVTYPDMAMDPKLASFIMFEGMELGLFGGGGLAKYFNATTNDPVGARHLVNGTDRADEIAGYYEKFLACLIDAPPAPVPAPKPTPAPSWFEGLWHRIFS
jgi:hypothetical protein